MAEDRPGHAVILIPARMASERFPGKVLAAETGRPLIQHVYEAASTAHAADRVVVATDDAKVADVVRNFGGEAVMTSAEHSNGTSRLAEAAAHLNLAGDSIVVNVQGDEPEIEPAVIDAAVRALGQAPMATIGSPFAEDEDPANPNIVKVVTAQDGRALYFSRSLIPYARTGESHVPPLKHVGLYVYRRDFLDAYVALAPTPLEQTEKLEQLRVLEHGYTINVAVCETRHHGIDTPEQYADFVRRHRGGS